MNQYTIGVHRWQPLPQPSIVESPVGTGERGRPAACAPPRRAASTGCPGRRARLPGVSAVFVPGGRAPVPPRCGRLPTQRGLVSLRGWRRLPRCFAAGAARNRVVALPLAPLARGLAALVQLRPRFALRARAHNPARLPAIPSTWRSPITPCQGAQMKILAKAWPEQGPLTRCDSPEGGRWDGRQGLPCQTPKLPTGKPSLRPAPPARSRRQTPLRRPPSPETPR